MALYDEFTTPAKVDAQINAKLNSQRDEQGGIAANDTTPLNLDSVSDFSTLSRNGRTSFYVKDVETGGLFTYKPSSDLLTPDGENIFLLPDGGFSVRNYQGTINRVLPAFDLGNARVMTSTAPDGKIIKSNVLNPSTGRYETFKEIDFVPSVIDGFIIVELEGKIYAEANFLETKQVNTSKVGISGTNTASQNYNLLQALCDLCVKINAELIINSELTPITISSGLVLTEHHSGLVIRGSGSGTTLSFPTGFNPEGDYRNMIQLRSSPTGHPKNIRISDLTLDGNKSAVLTTSGSGIRVYTPPGSAAAEDLNLTISNITTRNFIGAGVVSDGLGVLIENLITYNNGMHGAGTDVGSGNTILNNIISYGNGGLGIDISGGSAIVSNVWAFRNVAGGMKNSVDTLNLTMSNIYLYDNDGIGFTQTGESPDLELIIDGLTCKNNKARGLKVTQGKIKRLNNIVLINNNYEGIDTTDNEILNCTIGYMYVGQHNRVGGKPLRIVGGDNIISTFVYEYNTGSITYGLEEGVLSLTVLSGVIKNNIGIPFPVIGELNKVKLKDVHFIDTTAGNTQSTAVSGSGSSTIILDGCDFTKNPGQKVAPVTFSNVVEIKVSNCNGYVNDHVFSSNVDYTFAKKDRSRYNQFTGTSATFKNIVPPDIFDSGDIIQGEIEGGQRTFEAGSGVTLRYPTSQGLVAPTGARFTIKFKSANNALVTIIKNNQSAASADTASAVGATYVQTEVQAILTELRDLKTKMRTAGLLAT